MSEAGVAHYSPGSSTWERAESRGSPREHHRSHRATRQLSEADGHQHDSHDQQRGFTFGQRSDAEAKLRRFQAAIASGIDPAALVEVTNAAQKERAAARAELDGTPSPDLITDAEVYAMVDALGDVDAAVSEKNPTRLANLYSNADLQVRYFPAEDSAELRIGLGTRVNKVGVRGSSCANSRRLRHGRAALGTPKPTSPRRSVPSSRGRPREPDMIANRPLSVCAATVYNLHGSCSPSDSLLQQ